MPETTSIDRPKEYNDILKKNILNACIENFENIRFHGSDDIHSFFFNYTGFDSFTSWFNQQISKKNYFGSYQFFGETKKENNKNVPKIRTSKGPISMEDEKNFNTFWNAVIPRLPQMDGPGINLIQFAGLFSIVTNESSKFRPISEYGNLEYMFKYNRKPNKKANELFSDQDFKDAHSGMEYFDDVTGDSIHDIDKAWGGEKFPKVTSVNKNGFPTEAKDAGIIAECDFFKFRGRGFIQTTWRSAYLVLINEILNYEGKNKTVLEFKANWTEKYGSDKEKIATCTTNSDWDKLFQETNLEIATMAIKHFKESEHFMKIDIKSVPVLLGETNGSIRSIAKLVAGKGSITYHKIFENRVIQIVEQLLIDMVNKSETI